jgi:hypothetical protein
MGRVRDRIVDAPGSLGQRRRARRWEWLRDAFPDIRSMSVIDLGGTAEAWLRAPVRPALVHIVNLEPQPEDPPAPWIRADEADACDLPAHISNGRYDLVYSNSVIEHVGGHSQRVRFAEAVHKLADRHWVQTPYRYFPIEPHWMVPGMQFMPSTVRAELARRWPLSYGRGKPRQAMLTKVLRVELLDRTQFRYYFPDSLMRTETILGVPKSLIAYRSG